MSGEKAARAAGGSGLSFWSPRHALLPGAGPSLPEPQRGSL